MKWFKILVETENCWLEVEGENRLAGGFTTRGVVANTKEEARSLVKGQLEEELQSLLANNSQNPPTFNFREISESSQKKIESLSSSGFTWYLIEEQ